VLNKNILSFVTKARKEAVEINPSGPKGKNSSSTVLTNSFQTILHRLSQVLKSTAWWLHWISGQVLSSHSIVSSTRTVRT